MITENTPKLFLAIHKLVSRENNVNTLNKLRAKVLEDLQEETEMLECVREVVNILDENGKQNIKQSMIFYKALLALNNKIENRINVLEKRNEF